MDGVYPQYPEVPVESYCEVDGLPVIDHQRPPTPYFRWLYTLIKHKIYATFFWGAGR